MWIKQDPSYLDDDRLQALPDRAQLIYLKLRMLAGRCEANGAFVLKGRQLTEAQIAVHLRVRDSLETFMDDLKSLVSSQLITLNGRGYEITDWETDGQVDIEAVRAARRARDDKYDGRPASDKAATEQRRVGDKAATDTRPEETRGDKTRPEETRGDQPTTLPSSRGGARSGGQAGPASTTAAMLASMKPAQRKRAKQIAPILTAAGLRQPKLNTLIVVVATRTSIPSDGLSRYVLAGLASAYADPQAKNKAAVAAHRLELDQIAPEFKDPASWKSVPAEVLRAAGIKDLNRYIDNEKYGSYRA